MFYYYWLLLMPSAGICGSGPLWTKEPAVIFDLFATDLQVTIYGHKEDLNVSTVAAASLRPKWSHGW